MAAAAVGPATEVGAQTVEAVVSADNEEEGRMAGTAASVEALMAAVARAAAAVVELAAATAAVEMAVVVARVETGAVLETEEDEEGEKAVIVAVELPADEQAGWAAEAAEAAVLEARADAAVEVTATAAEAAGVARAVVLEV